MRSEDWPVDLKPHVYGNFKPDKTSRYYPSKATRLKHKREAREGNANAHLANLRQLWCVLGHERDSLTVHHLKTGPARLERGVGMRATDRWGVPLIWSRHDELERLGSRQEWAYFDAYAINPYSLANALWSNRDSLPRMGLVLVAFQLAATKTLLSRGESKVVPGAWLEHGK